MGTDGHAMDRYLRIRCKNLCVVLGIALAAPAAPAAAATDPLLAQQWALEPAAIGAQEAWTQSSGEGVLVAVLDTGLQLDHPDLAANVWTNPREVPATGVTTTRTASSTTSTGRT